MSLTKIMNSLRLRGENFDRNKKGFFLKKVMERKQGLEFANLIITEKLSVQPKVLEEKVVCAGGSSKPLGCWNSLQQGLF